MPMNTVIDDELMRDALRATGLKTKRQVVELGLQTLLGLHKQVQIRQLRGKLNWLLQRKCLSAVSKRSLHQNRVNPLAELKSHCFQSANVFKAKTLVQCN